MVLFQGHLGFFDGCYERRRSFDVVDVVEVDEGGAPDCHDDVNVVCEG
jgi:hypothetical protein